MRRRPEDSLQGYRTECPGDVLTVGGTGGAGSPIKLKAHNGQNSRQDNLIVPVGTVQSTLNGNTIDYPFNNPFVDQFLQNVGDTLVFSSQYAPNGHIKQLVAGLSATNKLVLQHPGVFGSQQYQNGLWVAVPFPQSTGRRRWSTWARPTPRAATWC